MRNKVIDSFLELLRAGLWQTSPQLDEVLTLAEWSELYELACEQAVVGLIFDGVTRLPSAMQPPMQWQAKLAAEAVRVERDNALVNGVQQQLVALFEKAGLRVLIVKGQTMGRYYAKPELRSSGDIDLFFCTEDEDKIAREQIERNGTEVTMSSDGSWKFFVSNVEVEVHPRIFDLMPKRIERKILETIGPWQKDQEGYLRLPPCSELLLISLHILKHCCGTGIRLKQLCDMTMASAGLMNEESRQCLNRLCKMAYVRRWNNELYEALMTYLGLPASHAVGQKKRMKPRALLRLILNEGKKRYAVPGRGSSEQPLVISKRKTLMGFVRHLPFSLFLAPYHVAVYVLILIKGNLH